jgi:ribosomal protein S18 acetylase RimI-like enzyme
MSTTHRHEAHRMTTCQTDCSTPTASPDGVRIVTLDGSGPTAAWMARLHVRELPHGLFPRLGVTFVKRWHGAHLESPHGMGFVALHAGRPIGFALGTTDRHANVSWLVTHRRRQLVPAGARALLLRPRLLVGFVMTRALRYRRRLFARTHVSGAGSSATHVAVLEAIVVEPHMRGRGVGTQLVRAFLEKAVDAGVDQAELVTKEGPAGAAGFYERGRWTLVGAHRDRDGETVLTYRIDTSQARPA